MPKTKPETESRRTRRTHTTETAPRPRRVPRKRLARARFEHALRDTRDALFELLDANAKPEHRACIRRVRQAIDGKRAPEFEDVAVTAEILVDTFHEDIANAGLGAASPAFVRELGLRFADTLHADTVHADRMHPPTPLRGHPTSDVVRVVPVTVQQAAIEDLRRAMANAVRAGVHGPLPGAGDADFRLAFA
jgi:hypothetical protein